jgi:hypothetical protein
MLLERRKEELKENFVEMETAQNTKAIIATLDSNIWKNS